MCPTGYREGGGEGRVCVCNVLYRFFQPCIMQGGPLQSCATISLRPHHCPLIIHHTITPLLLLSHPCYCCHTLATAVTPLLLLPRPCYCCHTLATAATPLLLLSRPCYCSHAHYFDAALCLFSPPCLLPPQLLIVLPPLPAFPCPPLRCSPLPASYPPPAPPPSGAGSDQ